MKEIIEDCTLPGDLIIDPFAGSGATGHAALELGRRIILVEKDPVWAEISKQRCELVYTRPSEGISPSI
jgi:site-specific DNA-methyltransferase (adenine-specific)